MKDSEHPDQRYYELAEKWRNGTITPQEEKEFSAWYNDSQDAPVIIPASFAYNEKQLRTRIWKKIQREKENKTSTITSALIYKMAAAAVITAVALGIYFNVKPTGVKKSNQQGLVRSSVKPRPGAGLATLTLDDGTVVSLDDVSNGTISQQGNSRVVKLSGGQLSYQSLKEITPLQKQAFNTIRTTRGGRYEVILPDNTKVWLNASSSIRFPTAFTGNEREVSLAGEAYFEVAKNKNMPFSVKVDEMKVVVLGTHFNIMAYKEEQEVKTTLLEGSVKLLSGNLNTRLNPGQQARLKEGAFTLIKQVNTDEVMAWKKGEFHFEGTQLKTIMRQIERWYDVSIAYEGDLSDIRLSGIISQKKEVGQLLEILEATHEIKCSLKGNTITVAPYK